MKGESIPGFGLPLPGDRPRLLVSVRTAWEAEQAILGGAEILDIKDPRRGSLGMADPVVMADIVQTARGLEPRLPVSAALGELADWRHHPQPEGWPQGLDYVKLGLSKCEPRDWAADWQAFQTGFPTCSGWVAVIYADWQAAQSPLPEHVLNALDVVSCEAVLLDTFQKDGRSLVEVLSESQRVRIAEAVHQRGLPLAVAGSLKQQDLKAIQNLKPEIIAIRSAACAQGDRQGLLCPDATRRFREHLETVSA